MSFCYRIHVYVQLCIYFIFISIKYDIYLEKLNSRLLNFVESSLIQERNKIITKKVQVRR